MAYSGRTGREALDLWFAMPSEMSVEQFVTELGYPSRSALAASETALVASGFGGRFLASAACARLGLVA